MEGRKDGNRRVGGKKGRKEVGNEELQRLTKERGKEGRKEGRKEGKKGN